MTPGLKMERHSGAHSRRVELPIFMNLQQAMGAPTSIRESRHRWAVLGSPIMRPNCFTRDFTFLHPLFHGVIGILPGSRQVPK